MKGKGRTQRMTQTEWIGGIIKLPIVIQDTNTHQPELIIWLNEDGLVLGQNMHPPGEAIFSVCTSLQNAIKTPLIDSTRKPTHVRVESEQMAAMLRAGFPDIKITGGPTPEVDELLESLKARFLDEPEFMLLSGGVSSADGAWFFTRAADLYRKKPWEILSADESLFTISIPEMKLNDLAVAVVGADGMEFGLVVFDRLEDHYQYLEAISDLENIATLPEHLMLTFEHKDDYPNNLLDEINEHQWKVASVHAYPMVFKVSPEGEFSSPTTKELVTVGASAHALAQIKKHHKAIQKALETDTDFTHTFVVTTPSGKMDATLTLVRPGQLQEDDDAMWTRLSQPEALDRIAFDERRGLEMQLVDLFAASPEAAGIAEVMHCPIIMDIAANYFGHTIATLPASDLREVIFDIVPAKVMMPASEAAELIEEMRAFYAFLGRRFGFARADACQKVLGRKAIPTLEKKLSDPSQMGMGKSLLMGGLEAGFDMQSMEGIQEFIALEMAKNKPLPPVASNTNRPKNPKK